MTKADLTKYRDLMIEIRKLDDEIEMWRTRAERSTQPLSKAPGGGGCNDPYPHIMDKIGEVEDVRNKKIAELGNVELALASLTPRESSIMRARYIEGKTWFEIAEEAHYTDRHVRRIHSSALVKLERCPLMSGSSVLL